MRNFKAIATYTIVGVLSLFGMSHFAYASDFFEWGISSSGIATENLSTAIGESGATNANVQWYVGAYPDTSTNPCASSNFPLSSWDAGYDIEAAFSVGCSTAPADGVFWVNVTKFGGGFDYYASFTRTGGVWSSVLADTSTRFISVDPVGTVATGTQTVGFEAYLNIDDWDLSDDMYYTFKIVPIDAYLPQPTLIYGYCGLIDSDCSDYRLSIDTFGNFSFSTTTVFTEIGRYRAEATLFRASFHIGGIPFFYRQLIATSSVFTVSTTTAFRAFEGVVDNYIREALASTTIQLGTVCNPIAGNFNIASCLVTLIVPSSDRIQEDITQLRTLPPWGYVFRFIDILGMESTTTLPTISYTFSTSSELTDSLGTITFDPFGTLLEAGSIVNTPSDQAEGKTIWEIMEPIIRLIVYLALGFVIIKDITGIKKSIE